MQKEDNATYQKDLRKLMISLGRCVRCHKNKAFGKYKHCPDCLEELQIRVGEFKDAHPGYNADYMRSRYERLKASGRCVSCGKNPASGGVLCMTCKYLRKQHPKPKKQKDPVEHIPGICKINGCGDPVAHGGKGLYCAFHYQKYAALAAHARDAGQGKGGWFG